VLGLVALGRTDSQLVISEWQLWRCVTALTLHSDVVHLVSNVVAGTGFGLLVLRLYGAGLGWFLTLFAGCLGNYITALLYYPDRHLAIGASTAVFGSLGILTASGIWMTFNQRDVRLSFPNWLLPLVGGFILLGLLGVGEGPVDVLAHFNGFLFGGLLGLVAAGFRSYLLKQQAFFCCIILLFLCLSWLVAFFVTSSQSALPESYQGLPIRAIL